MMCWRDRPSLKDHHETAVFALLGKGIFLVKLWRREDQNGGGGHGGVVPSDLAPKESESLHQHRSAFL